TLARSPYFVTRYPKASDLSSPPCLLRLLPAGANRRVGLAPTGKRRLFTAHAESSHSGENDYTQGHRVWRAGDLVELYLHHAGSERIETHDLAQSRTQATR